MNSKTQNWKSPGHAVLFWCPDTCQMAFYSHWGHFPGEPWNKVLYQQCQQTLQERNLQPPGRFQTHLQKAAKGVWIIWWLSQAVFSDPRSAGKSGAVAVSLELTLLPWSWAKNCLGQSWKVNVTKYLNNCFVVIFFLSEDHKAGILWLLLKKDCCFELVRNLQIIVSNMQNSVQ